MECLGQVGAVEQTDSTKALSDLEVDEVRSEQIGLCQDRPSFGTAVVRIRERIDHG